MRINFILLFILLCIDCNSVYANNTVIIQAEYFWDTDPGVNNGIAIPSFLANDSINITRTISTAGLKTGYHVLYIRSKDTEGNWSLSEGRSLYIKPVINSAEYFWDADPGANNGTVIPAFAVSDSVNMTKSISTAGLKSGYHVLYIRSKDTEGNWSLSEGRSLYIKPIIISAEYFWDIDPGVNNGTAIPAFAVSDSVNMTKSISTAGLKSGYHVLYIRSKDTEGNWSLSEGRSLYIKPIIISAEYFWDIDPGVNNGTAIPAFAVSDSINMTKSISTAGLKSGYHVLYIRSKDTEGNWSLSEGRSLYIKPIIISAEYFWDADPGVNNGTAISAFAVSDSINMTKSISTAGLKSGYHVLYIRSKNTDGIWSLSEGRGLYIETEITSAEYFWDADPGFDNGTAISSFANSDTVNFNATISTSGLRTGYHILYTRTKNTNGTWSLSEGRNIYIQSQISGGETFWDTDPGFGNGSPLLTLIPNDTISNIITFNSNGVSRGLHRLYMRYKNTDQTWGLSEGRKIKFVIPIIAAEYFYDNDPGQGNGNSLSITSGDIVNFSDGIIIPTLTSGIHKVFIRTMDSEGVWSHTESRHFYIPVLPSIAATKIIAAEYFIDTDPGLGNATAIPVSQTSTINFNGNISIPALTEGFHQLNIRTKDDFGKWSLAEQRKFYINEISDSATKINAAEFFVDDDPGIGNATPITINNPSSTINQCSNLTLPAFSSGTHKLFLRTQNDKGKWSLQEPREFTGISSGNVIISPASPVYVCNSGSVQLTATTSGNFSVQQWYNDCNLIVGGTGNSITVNSSGTYMVVVTDGSEIQTAFVDVIIVPRLFSYNVIGGGGYCSNSEDGATIQLTNSSASINYSLLYNGNSVQTIFAIGNVPLTFHNQTQTGNYTVIATEPLSGCTATMHGSANIFLTTASYWYSDADKDGYGNNSLDSLSCSQPTGYVTDNTDCNDTNPFVYPGRSEICYNGIDDNCDLQIDENCNTGTFLNFKVFIQGFYDAGSHLMTSILYTSGVGINPFECDTITVELYDPLSLSSPAMSASTILYADGNASLLLPSTVSGSVFYIVVKHRNSIETWSKEPVLFDGNPVIFDFTRP